MSLDDVILAIVSTCGKVEGRKRLQKFVHLLHVAGVAASVDFMIHHYGPFSERVALAADSMVSDGELKEELEIVAPYNTYQYAYKISGSKKLKLPNSVKRLIQTLDQFSTVQLEVASTIAYYENEGWRRDEAIKKTQYLKPTKAVPAVLKKAEEILSLVKRDKGAFSVM